MKKKLNNFSEKRLHQEIVGVVAHYRANIFSKIRVADCVDITKLPDPSLRRYALMAHFDVCVGDENDDPAFAIEFDGVGHASGNDHKKDAIANAAGLALFRVDETLLNRTRGGMTFLQYLVHTFFMGRAFREMQERGEIPYDEPFVMWGFLKPDAKHIFDSDFDFTSAPKRRLIKLLRVDDPHISPYQLKLTVALMSQRASRWVGFASIPLSGRLIYGRATLNIGTPCLGELDELPFGWAAVSDYCEGMVLEDLCDAVEIALADGHHTSLLPHAVAEEMQSLTKNGYRMARSFGSGTDPMLMDMGVGLRI